MLRTGTLLLLLISATAFGQTDSTEKKLKFQGDFRFRIEHDWNSRREDGSYREDRSRLRFRGRLGMTYQVLNWASFGARVRTGNLNDQQGPHVTLGGKNNEFGLIQVGFEKVYFKAEWKKFSFWMGKNDFPFVKKNELFWNDNVFPEGFAFNFSQNYDSSFINNWNMTAGHFIMVSYGGTFDRDSYFSGIQFSATMWNNRIQLFPSLFYFNRMNHLPDGKGNYTFNYAILHAGSEFNIIQKKDFRIGYDYYHNFTDYSTHDSIRSPLKNQKQGHVISMKYGKLEKAHDWTIELYGAYLQQFSIVDYFAQNDWVRWDYSSHGVSGSRITNFQGFELRLGYAFSENFNLILRTYWVEQLISSGAAKENGNRIRLDLNIGFN